MKTPSGEDGSVPLAASPVLGYDRPLLPGTVRIMRAAAGAVSIAIAPDTAKRTVYTMTRPILLGAIYCVIPWAFLQERTFHPAIAFLAFGIIAAVTALACFRVVARSGESIVFRADVEGLNVVNPLAAPGGRFYSADEIVALHLIRLSMISEPVCYQLELCVHSNLGKTVPETLLLSPRGEVLNKIGRTLCSALGLPEPQGDSVSWSSERPRSQSLSTDV